jgi:hypothetical protein
MKQTVALFGAAGKVGTRISAKLKDVADYEVLHVERGDAGMARLRERGVAPVPPEEAMARADLVVLAVPDVAIGSVAAGVVPHLRPGTLVMCLDPAAPYGGELPKRDDIAYFVVHPCHPPVVNDETDPEAKMDFYGGVKAKQVIVCALMQGSDADYARGEALARAMFAPVMRAHRITVEQMAVLEPAMAETVVLTCMFIMKEAMEEAVRHGVPAAAARDFLMGHINVNIGILFGYLNTNFSDAALLMVERAKAQLIQPDWRKVFEPDNLRTQVDAILGRK